MLASCLDAYKGCLFRSISLRSCQFCVRFFETQLVCSTTSYHKFSYKDTEILQYLSERKLQHARDLLEKMPQRGGQGRIVDWTSLLSNFSRDGFVDEARALFNIMPERNVVTYNAMLSAYAQCGRLSDACRLFEEMPERNVVSWTSMVCGLANGGRIDDARKLFHAMPERNVISWNSMLVGLMRNGNLEEARQVFDAMPVKNLVSWNAMIAGYAESHRMEEARVLFDKMQCRNVVTWTSLIAGYCRAGDVEEGYYLFCRMPERNVVSWTAMISGFTRNCFHEEALLLFIEMKSNCDSKPNEETLISLAYACAGIGFCCLSKQLHAHLIINGWFYNDYDGRLLKSVIFMYSMLGNMDFARHIFMKNSTNNSLQSLNYMINGYIRIGQLEKAQNMFDMGPIRDVISWTSMINGYFAAGQVAKACHLFSKMRNRDAVAWTVMISGHVQNELFTESTCLFAEMRIQGVSPLNSTYAVLIGAAGAMAYLDQGRQFHCLLIKTESEIDLILNNSLISMYAKCGEIDGAYSIFSSMIYRDLISWNSMIIGFSHHGLANEALEVFETMLKAGACPNNVTFLGTLSACAHAGLVNRGWEIFEAMNEVYGIQLGSEHYVCMINLLGRAGKLQEAEEFVLGLPFEPDHAIWGALLGVCAFNKNNAEIARRAAKRLLELDPLNAPAHVVLCNIYAANDQHAEEGKFRKEMGLKGVRKFPGCSWILLKGRVHMFVSGDRSRPQANEISLQLFGNIGES